VQLLLLLLLLGGTLPPSQYSPSPTVWEKLPLIVTVVACFELVTMSQVTCLFSQNSHFAVLEYNVLSFVMDEVCVD